MSKQKVKIIASKWRDHLHREPKYVPHRWRLVPNIVINTVCFLGSVIVVFVALYILIKYALQLFYHLK